MSKLRVFLVDDHAVLREGVKTLINREPDMEVVGEAADGRTACERAVQLLPDIVVMDASLPEVHGTAATREIVRLCPGVRVLALTVHEERCYVRELMEAGASGYLLKRSAAEELVRAVNVIARGGVYIDPALAMVMVNELAHSTSGRDGPTVDLSHREVEVLQLISQGYSHKEIGLRLKLSVKTVETHKARAMVKLGLTGRVEIVRYALHRGWLQQE